jgi:hypothetical protein
MSKQHYFAVFANLDDDGVFTWHVDTETSFAHGDDPVFNTETGEWESVLENHDEDMMLLYDLIDRILKPEKS